MAQQQDSSSKKDGLIGWNVNGISESKRMHLKQLAKTNNAKVIMLNETHLRRKDPDSNIQVPGYNVYRTERNGQDCGGSAILVHDSITSYPVRRLNNNVCEILAVNCPDSNEMFVVIYRKPRASSRHFRPIMELLWHLLNTHNAKKENWDVFIYGDFNFPNVTWRSSGKCYFTGKAAGRWMFFDLFSSRNWALSQLVLKPTRGTAYLDVLLTDNNGALEDVFTLEVDRKMSDHRVVVASFA